MAARLCISDERFRLSSDAEAAEVRRWHLDRIQALGIRWLRHDLRWRRLEPARGVYDFDSADAGIEEIHQRGLKLLAILDGPPRWAATPPEGGLGVGDPPPDDPADFAAFAGTVAERYGDRTAAFEVWNEENAGFRFWAPKEDPAAYAELLHQARGALQAAAPQVPVVYGGLFFHAQAILGAPEFLAAHIEAHPHATQGAGDFDVLGFHPYPYYPPSVPPESEEDGEMAFDHMVAQLVEVMRAAGTSRPLWATEYGWPDFDPVTPELQAAYLVRGALLLADAGVDRMCIFTLVDGPLAGTFPPEDSFGLFTWDTDKEGPGAPKPAYDAIRTLLEQAGARAPAGATPFSTPSRGVMGYRLADASGQTWVDVVFALDDAYAAEVEVALPTGTAVSARDLFGGAAPLSRSPSGARVHAATRPLFLAGRIHGD